MCRSGFFVLLIGVRLKLSTRIPALIAFGLIATICLIRVIHPGWLERMELMTYDMRCREALKFPVKVSTNLGFVFIDEKSIASVQNGLLGGRFGLYWPRQVYGRLAQELAAEGATTIAFDIIFGELRPDHSPVQMADGRLIESDEYFALQSKRAGNVIMAVTKEVIPPQLFLTNAAGIGDISTDKDPDGILRKARAFRTYRKWNVAFRQVEADPDMGINLEKARFEPGRIVLPRLDEKPIEVPLDSEGNFDMADFIGDKIPPGMARKQKPFTEEIIWHMGVVLAARHLGLDLSKAEIDLANGKIVLKGSRGVQRTIPVDREGTFYIDWCMPPNDPNLTHEAIQSLLVKHVNRLKGETNDIDQKWQGKLAVVGSSALGNDLTDRGATPLREDTLLVSKHWNVADSIITGRFVHRTPMNAELGLIVLMGVVAAVLTLELPVVLASGSVVLLVILYILAAVVVYVQTRYWLPIALPVAGAFMGMHGALLAWRVVFEQAQRRLIRSIFSKIVSPKIVNELEKAEKLPALGGVRREVTILFADVRGFTQLTDTTAERAAEYVRQNNLNPEQAEAYFDEHARETFATVNLYLGVVADILIKCDGTLDKFIGDCVMAFWGEPTPNPKHALSCVRAAIEAQQAIYSLNQQREEENRRREVENQARISAGLEPKTMLPVLLLGSGINTGMVNVGMMGSKNEQQNFTVFGREVNLASRLEGASGRGRIFIGETTYQHLLRDDPELAARCKELPLTELKGFRTAVKAYEVPWQADSAATVVKESSGSGTSFTSLIHRQS